MKTSPILVLALAAAVTGCRSLPSERPYALVLGTAQDGGLPHVGCRGEACEAARRNPEKGRLITSLLLADPKSGGRWLFDATPDLKQQVERARNHPPGRSAAGDKRPPLFDGIFLTHAHMGHYTGLFQLGKEAYGSRDVPLYVTQRMAAFLRVNDPWRSMLEAGALDLRIVEYDTPVPLTSELSVTALPVPHRDEYSDTVALLIEGPERTLLYLPDIDKWQRFALPIELLVEQVDVALLDGTFFEDGEIPGRSIDEIPHPFIAESMERFRKLPPDERRKIFFTHLNHTNPAADPGSAAAAAVQRAGLAIAREGQIEKL
ncbi:MAG: MBL fold metallo-hydrolase [Planctomycetota bacterium]